MKKQVKLNGVSLEPTAQKYLDLSNQASRVHDNTLNSTELAVNPGGPSVQSALNQRSMELSNSTISQPAGRPEQRKTSKFSRGFSRIATSISVSNVEKQSETADH